MKLRFFTRLKNSKQEEKKPSADTKESSEDISDSEELLRKILNNNP